MKLENRILTMVLVYASGGVILFPVYLLRDPPRPLMLLLTALFFLALAALQALVYLRARCAGQYKPCHEQLFLSPTYAALGAFWLWRGSTWDSGLYILLGLGFLGIAIVWARRTIQNIREDRAPGSINQD